MKKTFIALVLLGSVVMGYSQGSVNFNNNVAFTTAAPTAANGHANRLVYLNPGDTALVGTNYLAQLYFGLGAGQAEGSLSPLADAPSRFRVATTSSPGTWSGGTRVLPGTVPGTSTVTLQVRVWDGSLFPTYDAAVAGNGIVGKSLTYNYAVPALGSLPSAFFMEGLQSFSVAPIPEPSTYALAALGVGAVALIRRRKK